MPHTRNHGRTLGRNAAPLLLTALIGAALTAPTALAAPKPILWGYGNKPCRDFVAATQGQDATSPLAGEETVRYREWLSGLVTALNLATGTDVLAGAALDAALTRIQAQCQRRPADDFFTASMALIGSVSKVKGMGNKPRKGE